MAGCINGGTIYRQTPELLVVILLCILLMRVGLQLRLLMTLIVPVPKTFVPRMCMIQPVCTRLTLPL
jgi:hypothetical protein